jgi:SNF2 family DNA or RNA helicase
MAMLGKNAVRYDGTTSEDDRVQAIQDIQKGDKQFFVANAATAGEGLTLTAAKFSDYYENTFDLAARLQSEDRNHRIGQDRNVGYNDYIAKGTVDEHVVKCLQKKLNVAAQITGDKLRFLAGMTADQLGISTEDDMGQTVVQDVVAMFMGRT